MNRKRLNISEGAKDVIVYNLTNKLMTVTALANMHNCHPRSINRVMEERGLAAITSKAKGISDAARVKKMLKEAGITMDQLSQLVITLMAARLTNPDNLQRALMAGAGISNFSATQAAKARQAALFMPQGSASSAPVAV